MPEVPVGVAVIAAKQGIASKQLIKWNEPHPRFSKFLLFMRSERYDPRFFRLIHRDKASEREVNLTAFELPTFYLNGNYVVIAGNDANPPLSCPLFSTISRQSAKIICRATTMARQ
jgi:hypothetical protein